MSPDDPMKEPGVYAQVDVSLVATLSHPFIVTEENINCFKQLMDDAFGVFRYCEESYIRDRLLGICCAPNPSTIYVDEFERGLDPHAIRVIIDFLKKIAEERSLYIMLGTRSPIVLNQFRDTPENVFNASGQRLTALHDEIWIAQERLGRLYENGFFYLNAEEGEDASLD